MLAAMLDERLFDVHLFEKNAAPARKFLVAGEGGFNLTHSEPVEEMITRYHPESFFRPLLQQFSNTDLRRWLHSIGIPTYVGTSGRVFPEKGIKPIEVLQAILAVLGRKKVQLHLRHRWCGWEKERLLFETKDGVQAIDGGLVVFALGGASWKVTGSDGSWAELFSQRQVRIVPFQASNCAMQVRWPKAFLAEAEGKPLKNIAVSCEGRMKKGELVITATGIEGGAIYFHSPAIREQLQAKGTATVLLDLRPDQNAETLKKKIAGGGRSRSEQLKAAGLDKTAISLLKHFLSKPDYLDDEKLASAIKNFPLAITGLAPIDEAISTTGGIALDEVDEYFRLCRIANTWVTGEMLDWDAPTGGYLLQGCFSMGYVLAHQLNIGFSKSK